MMPVCNMDSGIRFTAMMLPLSVRAERRYTPPKQRQEKLLYVPR